MLRYQHKEELFKSNGEGFLDDTILKFTCSFIYSKKVLVDSDRKKTKKKNLVLDIMGSII